MKILLLLLLVCPIAWGKASVVFINPGKAEESFWQDVDLFANAAAKRLALDYRTFHGERNHYSMIKHIEWMINNQRLPDYLMLVNEKQALPRMLSLLEGQPVYVLVLLNDVSVEQQQLRNNNPHWQHYLLSCIVPNNLWAGYQTAQSMYLNAEQVVGEAVIISGDKTTPASVERTAGAADFFQHQAGIDLKQVIYGHWDEQRSYQQTKVLLKRYPDLKYLWTANDHMAFGSIKAIKELGKQPGRDVIVGTVNTSQQALLMREQGEISALAGGHFTAAGWGLSLIHRHIQGQTLPSKVNIPLFVMLQPGTEAFDTVKQKNWDAVMFENLLLEAGNPLSFQFTE